MKFCCVKKRFGFYFDQSGETSFSHVKKSFRPITNHGLSELCFCGLFRGHISRVALSGSFHKIIFSVYLSCS